MNDNTIRINLERERMLYLLDLFEKILEWIGCTSWSINT